MRAAFEQAREALKQNDLGRARTLWQALHAIAATDPNVQLLGATLLRLEGRVDDAMHALSELHRALPGDPSVAFQLGNALRDAGRADEAGEVYRQVLRRHRTHADAAFELGRLARARSPREAGPWFLRAARSDPTHFAAFQAAFDCARAAAGSEPPPQPAPHPAPSTQPISVVCCSIRPDRLARLRANLAQVMDRWELIHVPDARSLSEGYNRGLRQARAPLVVFCHDDVRLLSPQAGASIRHHLGRFDVIGVAGSTRLLGPAALWSGPPHGHGWIVYRDGDAFLPSVAGAYGPVVDDAEVLDGVFIAARRDVAMNLGFDEVAFDGFHLYDIDFSWRAHRAGWRVGIVQDLLVEHLSRGRFGAEWKTYAERFTRKHEQPFAPPRIPRTPSKPGPRASRRCVASTAGGSHGWMRWIAAEGRIRPCRRGGTPPQRARNVRTASTSSPTEATARQSWNWLTRKKSAQ